MQKRSNKYIQRITEDLIDDDFKSNKIIILMGPRQAGKTTLIKRVLEDKKAYFLNFDLDIDKQRFIAASKLDPSAAMNVFGNPDYLVIDEVQNLAESTKTVKGWYDSGLRVVFILLGSSAVEISGRTAESLAGRNIKRILPPLTFPEIIRAQSWSSGFEWKRLRKGFPEQIDTLLLSCIVFGQYPEAVISEDKKGYLLNLASDVLWKDLLNLGLVKTPESIRLLLTLLAHQVGSEASINELSNASKLARVTVERYLAVLEQAFIIFRLPAFSSNPRKEISKSQKFYFWDTGIRNALLNEFSDNPMRSDIGRLWENWVVSEFAKRNLIFGGRHSLYFWRSNGGSEVDLVVRTDDKVRAYEVKWNPRKSVNRAFTERYGVPVQPIHRSDPLFLLDEENAFVDDPVVTQRQMRAEWDGRDIEI